ncbi:MAG: tRNA (5-methylaminomethyl-2-thiouridylate)-methyltransferase [bacterium]|nr:tRNA (5-methylaminomethyl-2-thiouridylate)-methyltransferase [bacterium]
MSAASSAPVSSPRRRALALVSGGLDSLLAVRVVQEQGVEVEGINFFTGFCVEGHTHAIRKQAQKKEKRNNALWAAEQLGIKLHIVDISEEYKDVVLNPKHGYGANLNPCLDCKIFMVGKAMGYVDRARDFADSLPQGQGFDFIITGEVVGQRPKSQRAMTMPLIARESGAEDLLLRPLCAHRLAPTRPEREGWVDRDRLYGFSGRSRKPQVELAQQFGFTDWAQPAGGCCFLTDESYSRKLSDLWSARGERRYELDDIMLLKVGRHVRPAPHYKLIVGREEGENNFLEGYRRDFPHIRILSHNGPLTLVDGVPDENDLVQAARIAGRFSQGREADSIEVEIVAKNGVARQMSVVPLRTGEVPEAWYL